MERLCHNQTFLFTYNRIKDKNPNPSFNIEKFCQGWNTAMEFTTHVIKFKIVAKSNRIYFLLLQTTWYISYRR